MATNIGKISITARRAAYLCAAAGALTAGPPAFSSTQGTLGATSTGSVSITASVANRAQITGLTDISFSAVDPATAATSSQSDCVWSNTATKGYSITATGSGTSGAFTLANSALTAGTALGGLTTTAANPTCSTGAATTSSLIVSISAPNLQGMAAGASYTGTLTLLVTPQ